jgi:hypothetical protein
VHQLLDAELSTAGFTIESAYSSKKASPPHASERVTSSCSTS